MGNSQRQAVGNLSANMGDARALEQLQALVTLDPKTGNTHLMPLLKRSHSPSLSLSEQRGARTHCWHCRLWPTSGFPDSLGDEFKHNLVDFK